MRLSLCTDCLGQLPFERMLDRAAEMGVLGVEMTVGGWSPAPLLRADELLADVGKLRWARRRAAARARPGARMLVDEPSNDSQA